MLESECRYANVKIVVDAKISEVRRDTAFTVRTDAIEYRAPALVVATGGISIPKMGATAFGYDLARQFGLNIVQTRPALVPLVFHPADRKRYSDLAGVSAEVIASAGNSSFREKMLFTHRGVSGPAILQASSYWKEGEPLQIDLAPGRDATQKIREAGTRTAAVAEKALHEFLPNRLAERWLEFHPPKAWTNIALDAFESELHAWTIRPAGTEGYEKAEVTAGGVDTADLSSKTMEARKIPGLFFIGEVVDVTGYLGGFNFQWAWASAAAAGRAL
jgi:predicted Rossmann fold flavoprotein